MNRDEFLSPEEQLNAPLIADLRSLYAQPEEDTQSLSRIQQRLTDGYSQDIRFSASPETIRKTRQERAYVLNSYENNLEKLHVRRSSWLRSFNMVAAAVFVTLLVGSMVLVFTHVRLAGSAGGPALPATPTPMPVVCNTPTPTPTVTFPPTPTPTPISHAVIPTPTPIAIIGSPQCATPTPMPTPTPITPTPFPTGIPTPTPTPRPTPIP